MALLYTLLGFAISVTLVQGKCYFGDKSYETNEHFVFKACDGYCRCTDTGFFNCSTLCKTSTDECQADEKEVEVKYQSPLATRCICKTRKCLKKPPVKKPEKGMCTINGKSYKFGKTFVPDSCVGYCKCTDEYNANCTSLCPSQRTECAPLTNAIYETKRVLLNTNCSCTTKRCVEENVNDTDVKKNPESPKNSTCFIDGQVYPFGKLFVPNSCAGLCQCITPTSMQCGPLCKPKIMKCKPGERLRSDLEESSLNWRCSCPVRKCVKRRREMQKIVPKKVALPGPPSRFTCTIKGKTYRYRQTFVPDTCEGYCQCSGRNSMKCEPLCPRSNECAPHQDRRVTTKPVLLNPKCSCKVQECLGEEPDEHLHDKRAAIVLAIKKCKIDGKEYSYGKTFVPDNCKGFCQCTGDKTMKCTSLCPKEDLKCASDEQEETVYETILLNRRCQCPLRKCVKKPKTCKIEGKSHSYDKTFVPDTCRGYCKCNGPMSIQCLPLCPLVVEKCKPNEKLVVEKKRVILNPKCSCEMRRCLKVERIVALSSPQLLSKDTTCTIEGKQYDLKKTFVPDSCEGYCKCSGKSSMKCTPLCPTQKQDPSCNANERIERVQAAVIINPKCSCKMKVCVPKSEDKDKAGVCKVMGKTYRSGKTFVPDTCRGYCQCKGPGSMKCSPLCPQQQVVCSANEVQTVVTRKVLLNVKCSCEVIHCTPNLKNLDLDKQVMLSESSQDFCMVDDKKYRLKRTFVPDSCRGFCKCNGPSNLQCTPLCPQKKITCEAGEQKIVATTKVILNPRCTCEILKCVRKKSTFVSVFENLFGRSGMKSSK